jgi:hypothetical protein
MRKLLAVVLIGLLTGCASTGGVKKAGTWG